MCSGRTSSICISKSSHGDRTRGCSGNSNGSLSARPILRFLPAIRFAGAVTGSAVGGRFVPAEMQAERKFESADTPPNRFVKFALLGFRELCDSVLQAKRNGKPAFAPDDAVSLEATSMLRSLDALLSQPLFDDVGELRRIPFESTTLQRREGYREILLAWLMLDAAAQLDWPGRRGRL